MSLCWIETASVVAQFQANRLRIENKMDLEVTGTSVPERIGQNLLSNAQQIFLPLLRHQLRFTLNPEFGVQVRARDHLPDQFLDRRTQILPGQNQRPERMYRAARFLQAVASEIARTLNMSGRILGEIDLKWMSESRRDSFRLPQESVKHPQDR